MSCERVRIGDSIGFICGGRKVHEKPPAITWPAEPKQLIAAGYRFKYARRCRLCDAVIEFFSTPAGKFIPLDRLPDLRRVPHHSTCPRVEEFRRKSKQQELFKT